MKIHGHRFDELYRAFPWSFRLLIVVSTAFLLFLLIHFGLLLTVHDTRGDPGPLTFRGIEDYNGFDPALASDGQQAALAYSGVMSTYSKTRMAPEAPGIAIALANKDCRQWSPGQIVIMPRDDVIVAPDGKTTIAAGIWRTETPGIVYDPSDPDSARAWKLYAYRYIWTNDNNPAAARRYNGIVLRTAPKPDGPWSPEVWVFSAGQEYPPAPYQDLVQLRLDSLDPALGDVTMYARPSVVDAAGTLVMSLSAFTSGETPDRVVMIVSGDHGKTWRYVGAPLTAADARALGYATLGGATLLKKGGHIYLAAVFGDGKTAGLGTFIFTFSDIAKGQLARDGKTSAPVLAKHIPRASKAPTAIGGGFAAYTDACAELGVVTGEHSGLKRVFQIFRTMKQPDAAD
jgi:hypothetical protein